MCLKMHLRRLRLWLLVVALVCGQAAMLAHGVEHHDEDEAGHPCLVCLAGQNVDGAVPPPAATVFNHDSTPLPTADGNEQGFPRPAVVSPAARAPPRA